MRNGEIFVKGDSCLLFGFKVTNVGRSRPRRTHTDAGACPGSGGRQEAETRTGRPHVISGSRKQRIWGFGTEGSRRGNAEQEMSSLSSIAGALRECPQDADKCYQRTAGTAGALIASLGRRKRLEKGPGVWREARARLSRGRTPAARLHFTKERTCASYGYGLFQCPECCSLALA